MLRAIKLCNGSVVSSLGRSSILSLVAASAGWLAVGALVPWVAGAAVYTGPSVIVSATSSAVQPGTPQIEGYIVNSAVEDGSGGWFVAGAALRDRNDPSDATELNAVEPKVVHVRPDGTIDPLFVVATGAHNEFGGIRLYRVGARLYLAGGFAAVNGVARRGLAAVDTATGAVLPWNPGGDGSIEASDLAGDTLYVYGSFSRFAGQTRDHLAAVSLSTGEILPWTASGVTGVDALAVGNGAVYLGGHFSTVSGVPRMNAAALDAQTGAVTSWNPAPNQGVRDLEVTANRVYAAGDFFVIGGEDRVGVAALDPASGAAQGWDAHLQSNEVNDIDLDGTTLYLAGVFGAVAGLPRCCAAAVDADSGAPTAFDPQLDNSAFFIRSSGDRVFIGGFFSSAGTEQAPSPPTPPADPPRPQPEPTNPPTSTAPTTASVPPSPSTTPVPQTTVTMPPLTATTASPAPAPPTVTVPGSIRLTALREGVRVSVRLVRARSTVSAQLLQGRRIVGTKRTTATAKGMATVRVALTPSGRRQVRRGAQLRLRVTVRRPDGKTVTTVRLVRIT